MTKKQLDTIRFYLDVATVAVTVFSLVHRWRKRHRLPFQPFTPVPVFYSTTVPDGWEIKYDTVTSDPTLYTS